MTPELNAANAEVAAALKEFSHSCVALAKLLQSGTNLTEVQRLTIDNSLAIVQLNYAVWNRQCKEIISPGAKTA